MKNSGKYENMIGSAVPIAIMEYGVLYRHHKKLSPTAHIAANT